MAFLDPTQADLTIRRSGSETFTKVLIAHGGTRRPMQSRLCWIRLESAEIRWGRGVKGAAISPFPQANTSGSLPMQQCCGSGFLSRIPDPNFFHPGSRIRVFSILDPGSEFFPSRIPDPNFFHPGSAAKNLSILTQKIVSKFSEI